MDSKMYFQKGNYYHLYNRGINGNRIFFNDRNYIYLTKILSDTICKHKISIVAYCLMPNHYHLLLRQDSDIPASKWIQNVLINMYSL